MPKSAIVAIVAVLIISLISTTIFAIIGKKRSKRLIEEANAFIEQNLPSRAIIAYSGRPQVFKVNGKSFPKENSFNLAGNRLYALEPGDYELQFQFDITGLRNSAQTGKETVKVHVEANKEYNFNFTYFFEDDESSYSHYQVYKTYATAQGGMKSILLFGEEEPGFLVSIFKRDMNL